MEEEVTEIQGHRVWVSITPEGEAAIGRIAIWAAGAPITASLISRNLTMTGWGGGLVLS